MIPRIGGRRARITIPGLIASNVGRSPMIQARLRAGLGGSEVMNVHAGTLFRPERLMRKSTTRDLSVVAAQLIEAACRARGGDREGARECIAHAVTLLRGKPSLEPGITRGLSKGCDAATPMSYRSLSPREAGVLRMIAWGMSNKCIARSLGITPETVKTHVKAILSKLRARTRAQAVARVEASACFESLHAARRHRRSGGSAR